MKEFESFQQDISSSSTHVTPTIDFSFDASSFVSSPPGLATVFSLIADVRPLTLNYFIDNESVHSRPPTSHLFLRSPFQPPRLPLNFGVQMSFEEFSLHFMS